MASTPDNEDITTPPATAEVTPQDEEPYSVFDNRQKALIVLLVSTAATCEYLCRSGITY